MVALCCSGDTIDAHDDGLPGERHAPSARRRRHRLQLQHGDRQAADVDGGAGVSARARHVQMIEMAESACFPT